jgi:hypothetical protein
MDIGIIVERCDIILLLEFFDRMRATRAATDMEEEFPWHENWEVSGV